MKHLRTLTMVSLEMRECRACDLVQKQKLACVHMCPEGTPQLTCPCATTKWVVIKRRKKEVEL